jgi:transposase
LDDRPWGGSDPPDVAYVYAPDRKAERPTAHLEGFKGILQVDGYAGYRKLADRGDVRLAFCWSHVRRNFYELATPGPAPIASEALEYTAALYSVEKDIRGRSADERRAVRQQKSRSLGDALEPWLRAKLALTSRKSKLAEAIRYALSRWEGLTRFIDDSRIELDNNTVERSIRSIRPIALNRKNALRPPSNKPAGPFTERLIFGLFFNRQFKIRGGSSSLKAPRYIPQKVTFNLNFVTLILDKFWLSFESE